jgi:hypothetical protein
MSRPESSPEAEWSLEEFATRRLQYGSRVGENLRARCKTVSPACYLFEEREEVALLITLARDTDAFSEAELDRLYAEYGKLCYGLENQDTFSEESLSVLAEQFGWRTSDD